MMTKVSHSETDFNYRLGATIVAALDTYRCIFNVDSPSFLQRVAETTTRVAESYQAQGLTVFNDDFKQRFLLMSRTARKVSPSIGLASKTI